MPPKGGKGKGKAAKTTTKTAAAASGGAGSAAAAGGAAGAAKKRRTSRVESYGTYIYKVLKQVHWCSKSWTHVEAFKIVDTFLNEWKSEFFVFPRNRLLSAPAVTAML